MSFSSDLLGFANHCNQEPHQMFPSSNYNGNDLIFCSDNNPISHTPFYSYTTITNSSKHLDEQYCHTNYLHLSPLCHYELEGIEDHEFFNFYNPQQSIKDTDDSLSNFRRDESTSVDKSISKDMKIEKVSTTTAAGAKGLKKSGKKDRHSKIDTAHGPRDRRMRLSLKVAREFFDLQDKLCYDKASKTVEWLLTQAKPEIKKLASGLPNINFMSCSVNNAAKTASSATNSEGEILSQINHTEPIKESSICVKSKERKIKQQQSTKNAFRGGPVAKESRKKARARARERTRRMNQNDDHHNHHHQETCNNDQLIQLSSWSPFEAADSSSGHNNNPSMDPVEKPSYHEHQGTTTPPSHAGMHKYWNNTSCPPTFGYLLNNSTSTLGIPQQNQSTYSQFFNKPWDCYNNINQY